MYRAEAVANYIRDTAKIPLKFARPVDKSKLISLVLLTLATVLMVWRAWPVFKTLLSFKWIWSALTVVRHQLTSAHRCKKARS